MKRLAVYTRVSTTEQAENGWSLHGQYDECRKFLESEYPDSRLVRVYRDAGASGSTIERDGLQLMMYHASIDVFDVLVVWKYDRLSRSNTDFPMIMNYLTQNKVEIRSAKEPMGNYEDPTSELMIGLIGLMSTFERKTLLMRSRMGKRERARRGLWHGGKPPFGYVYNEDTGCLEAHPVESETVKLMFRMFFEIQSLRGLGRYLDSQGLKTRNDTGWSATKVRQILKNEIYNGVMNCMDVTYLEEDYRLVDKETFEKVQEWLAMTGIPPYGYIRNPETGKLEVYEDEAEAVRISFEKFLVEDGFIPAVTVFLNRNGYKQRNGKRWHRCRLYCLLNKPIYKGEYHVGQKIIYDESLQIVPPEMFDKAQVLGAKYYSCFRKYAEKSHHKVG